MSEELKQVVVEAMNHPKVTGGLTATAILNCIFEFGPQAITVCAAASGLYLTICLIIKARAETKKLEIDIRIQAEIEQRQKEGYL